MVQSNIISLPVGMFFYTPIQGCLYVNKYCCCCSVANSCPTLCDPMALQHARLPCPSLSPGVCSNSCPLSQWCHPAISFLCCPILLLPSNLCSIRFFSNELALGFRWPKYCSFSISLSSEYSGWFPLGLTGLISLLSKGLKSLLQHYGLKADRKSVV